MVRFWMANWYRVQDGQLVPCGRHEDDDSATTSDGAVLGCVLDPSSSACGFLEPERKIAEHQGA